MAGVIPGTARQPVQSRRPFPRGASCHLNFSVVAQAGIGALGRAGSFLDSHEPMERSRHGCWDLVPSPRALFFRLVFMASASPSKYSEQWSSCPAWAYFSATVPMISKRTLLPALGALHAVTVTAWFPYWSGATAMSTSVANPQRRIRLEKMKGKKSSPLANNCFQKVPKCMLMGASPGAEVTLNFFLSSAWTKGSTGWTTAASITHVCVGKINFNRESG